MRCHPSHVHAMACPRSHPFAGAGERILIFYRSDATPSGAGSHDGGTPMLRKKASTGSVAGGSAAGAGAATGALSASSVGIAYTPAKSTNALAALKLPAFASVMIASLISSTDAQISRFYPVHYHLPRFQRGESGCRLRGLLAALARATGLLRRHDLLVRRAVGSGHGRLLLALWSAALDECHEIVLLGEVNDVGVTPLGYAAFVALLFATKSSSIAFRAITSAP